MQWNISQLHHMTWTILSVTFEKKTSKTTNHRLTMSIFPAALAKCHVIPFSRQTLKKKHNQPVNGQKQKTSHKSTEIPSLKKHTEEVLCVLSVFSKGSLMPQFARKKPYRDPDSELFVGFVSLLPPGTPHTREKKHKKNTVWCICLLCCFHLKVLKLQSETNVQLSSWTNLRVPLPTKNEYHPAYPKIEIRPYLKGIPTTLQVNIWGETRWWSLVKNSMEFWSCFERGNPRKHQQKYQNMVWQETACSVEDCRSK